MKISSFAISTVLVASASFAGSTATAPRWASEFAVASINVERNATDGDTEVVISVVPGDEGLKYLTLRAPNKRTIFDSFSLDRSVLGMREFNLESPEPSGEAICRPIHRAYTSSPGAASPVNGFVVRCVFHI